MTTERFYELLWRDIKNLQEYHRRLLSSNNIDEDYLEDKDLSIVDGRGNIVETAEEVEEWNEKDYPHK
jgi:hypothetical protein